MHAILTAVHGAHAPVVAAHRDGLNDNSADNAIGFDDPVDWCSSVDLVVVVDALSSASEHAGGHLHQSVNAWNRLFAQAPLPLLEAEIQFGYQMAGLLRKLDHMALETGTESVNSPGESLLMQRGSSEAALAGVVESTDWLATKCGIEAPAVATDSLTRRRRQVWGSDDDIPAGWRGVLKQGKLEGFFWINTRGHMEWSQISYGATLW